MQSSLPDIEQKELLKFLLKTNNKLSIHTKETVKCCNTHGRSPRRITATCRPMTKNKQGNKPHHRTGKRHFKTGTNLRTGQQPARMTHRRITQLLALIQRAACHKGAVPRMMHPQQPNTFPFYIHNTGTNRLMKPIIMNYKH